MIADFDLDKGNRTVLPAVFPALSQPRILDGIVSLIKL